ncbi:uncharacterized protein [Parasteatoda tepidariorum]|uniref:uncharacterized protein n=1 Tax=Parasteatoda tepidariorum TaxID=114398 RepID=UPI0039BD1541
MADPENYTPRCSETRCFSFFATVAVCFLFAMVLTFIILDGFTFFTTLCIAFVFAGVASFFIVKHIIKTDASTRAPIVEQIWNHHWNRGYRREELNERGNLDEESNNAPTTLNNQQLRPNIPPRPDIAFISATRIINDLTTDENAISINLSGANGNSPSVHYSKTISDQNIEPNSQPLPDVEMEDDNQSGNKSEAFKCLGQKLEGLDVARLQSSSDIPMNDLNSKGAKPKRPICLPNPDAELFLISNIKNDLSAEGSGISINLSGASGELPSVSFCKMISDQDNEQNSESLPGTETDDENSEKEMEDIDQTEQEAIKRFDPKRKVFKATEPRFLSLPNIKMDDHNFKEFEPKGQIHGGNGVDVFKSFDEKWKELEPREPRWLSASDIEDDDHYSREFEPEDDEIGDEVEIFKSIGRKWSRF